MSKNNQMTTLPADFVPGPYDVICAKGKIATFHSGNKYYRQLIQQALPQYSDAESKFSKSMIVSEIVHEVRSRSKGGGFVKAINGVWHEVGDHHAREKIGQAFRDALSSQYKSSARAKKRRQKIVSVGVANQFELMLQKNSFLSRRIHKLTTTALESVLHRQKQKELRVGLPYNDSEEAELDQMFSRLNLELLEAFKKNDKLLQQFNESEVSYKKNGVGRA